MDSSAVEADARMGIPSTLGPAGEKSPDIEPTDASILRGTIWLIVALIVVLFYSICYNVTTNGPVLDDYNAVLGFMIFWSKGQSLGQLIEAHNDHRIVLSRLFTLLDLKLNGTVNFQHLVLCGVLALLPIALATYAFLLRFDREPFSRNARLVLLAVVALLVFRPEHIKHIGYAMANITALWSVAFALLFFLFLSRSGLPNLALALLALVGALGSNSSSLLLMPLAAVKFGLERRWLAAGVALVGGVLCGIVYSSGGVTISYMIAALRHDLLPALGFFFALVGSSAFQLDPARLVLPFLTGLLIVAACGAVVVRTRNVDLFVVFAYLLLCDALVALGRVAVYRGQLMEIALDGRYRIYSVVLLAFLAGLLFQRLSRQPARQSYAMGVVAMSALLCLNSYLVQLPLLMRWHDAQYRLITDNARETPPPPTTLRESWAQTMKRAVRKGLYTPPR